MTTKDKDSKQDLSNDAVVEDAENAGVEEPVVEDLNSTMMSIDISKLDLNGSTRTDIKISSLDEEDTGDDVFDQNLLRKPSLFSRIKQKFLLRFASKSTKPRTSQSRDLPKFLKYFVGSWICPHEQALPAKIIFYVFRFLILSLSIYLHSIVVNLILTSLDTDHPAKNIFVIGGGVDLGLVLLTIIFRMSASWLATLPLTVLAVYFVIGIFSFHSADLLYFSYNGLSISDSLNYFFLLVLIYTLLTAVVVVFRNIAARILVGLICSIGLVAIGLNFHQALPFEFSLHGAGILEFIPYYFLYPSYFFLHVVLPVLVVLFLFNSFGTSKVFSKIQARGYARSLTLLLCVTSALGLGLLQKNRVFHLGNFFMPYALDVAASEIEVFNQKLRVETSNFKRHAGNDDKSRYKMNLKKGLKDDQYLLQVVDEFNFPIKNLSKSDLILYADGKRIKKFDLVEIKDMALNRGSYLLTVKLESKQALVTWDKPAKVMSDKDKLVFKITDLSKVKRLVARQGEETYLDVKAPTQEVYSLPLSYFESGPYELTVMAYDEYEQNVFEGTIAFTTKVGSDIALLSPVQGDSVGNDLSVLIFPKSVDRSEMTSIAYKIDDAVMLETTNPVFFTSLDVSTLQEGAHTLAVLITTGKGTITKTVTFYKKSNSPELTITRPGMGVFALRDTEITFDVPSEPAAKLAGVKIFVNGTLFEDYSLKDKSFSLPVSRWEQSELFVSVQGVLEDGTNVSDWIQINKGLGVLEIDFDIKSLDFINYSNVAMILDASVSHLDHWQGKEKWYWIKRLVMDTKTEEKIKIFKPSMIVFGHTKPYYYNDCSDFEVVSEKSGYNPIILKRKLNEIKPSGISSLLTSLKKSFAQKPDKIFVITDSRDGCKNRMANELNKLKKISPKTQVVVFVLGQPSKKDLAELTQLAETTGGRFFQPTNYEALRKTLLDELELTYELHSSNEMIVREALGSKKMRLVPGKYVLKIPYGSTTKEVDFVLQNGTKTKVKISGKDKAIHVNVNESRL